jgi:phenylacetate-coenzyme A ligase PaaK-like adenylate-forming protein
MPRVTLDSGLKSSAADILWPVIAPPAAANSLAILYQLERSQWWPAAALRKAQFRQLNVLLAHARSSVPYYRELGLPSGRAVTPEAWHEIPILTRDRLQRAGTGLHSTALPKGHGPTSVISSSGSTGRPVQAIVSRIRQVFWDAFTLREHVWHGRDAGSKLASIRAFPTGKAVYPRGLRGPNWGGPVAAVYRTGAAAGLSVVSSVEEQAEWLVRENPTYLLTFPSALRALAHHCRDRGIALPSLRQARTISEVLGPDTRAAVRDAWGVEIADTYSANEIGYMALQCPDHESLHVQSEGVYLEILRDDGTPCEAGETGRVIVTSLHNFAMPLIRYEIGDYAEAGPPCPCGRGLPVIARVLGRVRNMLRLPSGGEVWPLIGEPSYAEIPAIRQFQIAQKSHALLEMRLVTDRPLTPEEEAKLSEIVLKRLGHRFEIALTYHDEIQRSAGGKFEDFKCEIENP